MCRISASLFQHAIRDYAISMLGGLIFVGVLRFARNAAKIKKAGSVLASGWPWNLRLTLMYAPEGSRTLAKARYLQSGSLSP